MERSGYPFPSTSKGRHRDLGQLDFSSHAAGREACSNHDLRVAVAARDGPEPSCRWDQRHPGLRAAVVNHRDADDRVLRDSDNVRDSVAIAHPVDGREDEQRLVESTAQAAGRAAGMYAAHRNEAEAARARGSTDQRERPAGPLSSQATNDAEGRRVEAELRSRAVTFALLLVTASRRRSLWRMLPTEVRRQL